MSKSGKKNKSGLGRALIKDRSSKTRNCKRVEDSMLHTTEMNDGYDWGRLNLQSVTAESSLTEFLATAALAQKEFKAEKLNAKFISTAPTEVKVVTSQPDFSEPLRVPRRPKWVEGVSAEEQLAKEKEAFLEWRKGLNELQQTLGAALTPYERNLEIWRQLWRTLEKSDVALIFLDARNPLLFRCEDLERYAKELKCATILLINKADLISDQLREEWGSYFRDEGRIAVFFSAKASQELEVISEDDNGKNEKESEINAVNSDSEVDDTEQLKATSADIASETEVDDTEQLKATSDDIASETEVDDTEQLKATSEDLASETEVDDTEQLKATSDDIDSFQERLRILDKAVTNTARDFSNITAVFNNLVSNINGSLEFNKLLFNNCQNLSAELTKSVADNFSIHDRNDLMTFILNLHLKRKVPSKFVVGMIGYPNVGKSSTVNILMKTKKVSVSSMPGHTRFVQSLMLTRDIELLDCPGLVLPAYAVAPDLLLTAVLPIDQMRSHDSAVARLCELVPKRVFEKKYGLLLPENETDEPLYKQILTSHAFNRGFMTAAGQPDQSRSARILLKEASSGALSWGVVPPESHLPEYPFPLEDDTKESKNTNKRNPTPRERRAVEGWGTKAAEIDKTFFAAGNSGVHVKGKNIKGVESAGEPSSREVIKSRKANKKHANKNKKEKLRRVYSHLDEH